MKKVLIVLLMALLSMTACSQREPEQFKVESDSIAVFENNVELTRLSVPTEITISKKHIQFRNLKNDSLLVFTVDKALNDTTFKDGSRGYALRCIDEELKMYVYMSFVYYPSGNLGSVALGTANTCMIFLIKIPNNKNL